MGSWSIEDSAELYNVDAWGRGYFRVNELGNLEMVPPGQETSAIDLRVLVEDLRRRGLDAPVLLRFGDLIKARIDELAGCFATAIAEYEYDGRFRGVYPIKVNQQRHQVEDLVRYSRPHHMGLEAGSKPELLVVMALLDDPEALIVCNGYKDREYVETAFLANRLGRNCIIVIEQLSELETVIQAARDMGVQPRLGVRAKLASAGSGRWASSAGDRAKFGLAAAEIIRLIERLREVDGLGWLELLHFHLGSQVSAIRAFKTALKEAARMYTELCRLGARMGYLDVGGGLGVDYDGSRTSMASSVNYDMQEYAYDVVAAIQEACDDAGVRHPHLITEAGRALMAYSSVLIVEVLGVSHRLPSERPPAADASPSVAELWEVLESVDEDRLQEPYHDAQEIRDECLARFNLGMARLEERAHVERLYWAVLERIAKVATKAEYVPDEVQRMLRSLADTYYCNFSLFQSAPDSWAVSQLFPILPIHRLDEEPNRRGVLADITCDSDGKVARFIDRRKVKDTLELHDPADQPYYLGMFLVGAYQEILGDLHNLFGDTNAVHVAAIDKAPGYRIVDVVEGDTVTEVLKYVQYDRQYMLRTIRGAVEEAIEAERLTIEEGAGLVEHYIKGLDGYTYLE